MTTLAQHQNGDGQEAVVMEARNGGEDYWFVFDGPGGAECVIAFDHVEFDFTESGSIRSIEFYRDDPRRPPMEVGSVEGGSATWGAEVVRTIAQLGRDE